MVDNISSFPSQPEHNTNINEGNRRPSHLPQNDNFRRLGHPRHPHKNPENKGETNVDSPEPSSIFDIPKDEKNPRKPIGKEDENGPAKGEDRPVKGENRPVKGNQPGKGEHRPIKNGHHPLKGEHRPIKHEHRPIKHEPPQHKHASSSKTENSKSFGNSSVREKHKDVGFESEEEGELFPLEAMSEGEGFIEEGQPGIKPEQQGLKTPNQTASTGAKKGEDTIQHRDLKGEKTDASKSLNKLDKNKKVDEPKEARSEGSQYKGEGVMAAGSVQSAQFQSEKVQINKEPVSDSNIKEIVRQLVDRIEVMQQGNETTTTITLREPPIMAGATVRLTTTESTKNEFNISFANLSPDAKALIDRKLNDGSLEAALDRKGIVVTGMTTTTQPDRPVMTEESGKPSREGQDQEGRGGDQQGGDQQGGQRQQQRQR